VRTRDVGRDLTTHERTLEDRSALLGGCALNLAAVLIEKRERHGEAGHERALTPHFHDTRHRADLANDGTALNSYACPGRVDGCISSENVRPILRRDEEK